MPRTGFTFRDMLAFLAVLWGVTLWVTSGETAPAVVGFHVAAILLSWSRASDPVRAIIFWTLLFGFIYIMLPSVR